MASNGWDDATAALQLLSHLAGGALNVALLVPANRRASQMGLMDVLTAHYGSPGRLVDYRRQFERLTWAAGTDPSIYATELEMLAMKAFGDMGHLARLRLVRDRFITRQDSCALRRHLDSVSRETLIRDIVDRCQVWESHADLEDKRGWYPSPGRSLPLYTINEWGTEGDDLPGAADDMTPEHLLPTPVVSPPKATPIPSELELLIQRLMGNDRLVQPAPTRRSGFTNMEVLIHHLLPATPPVREQPTRESGHRDWSTAVCFSGGKLSQAKSQCPALDVTFPFLPPGWQAEKVGGGFVMQSPRFLAERLRTENGD